MIENIFHNGIRLSIIIRNKYSSEGISFFTQDQDSQQLGYMNRPKDYVIPPHRHNLVPREVHLTQEVLFIKSGKIRVDFYSNDQEYFTSRILVQGDVILLSDGGHGFKMLETSEIIEVKQGPYIETMDKVRFESIKDEVINFNQ